MADTAKANKDMNGLASIGGTLLQQWIDGARALSEQAGAPRMAEIFTEQLAQAENSVQSALQAQRQWLARGRERAAGTSALPLPAAINSFAWDALELNLELREKLWHTGFDIARKTGEQLRQPVGADQASLLEAWNDMSRNAGARYREWLQALSQQAAVQAEADTADQSEETKAPASAKSNQRAAKSA